jgi:hypothetical protein
MREIDAGGPMHVNEAGRLETPRERLDGFSEEKAPTPRVHFGVVVVRTNPGNLARIEHQQS